MLSQTLITNNLLYNMHSFFKTAHQKALKWFVQTNCHYYLSNIIHSLSSIRNKIDKQIQKSFIKDTVYDSNNSFQSFSAVIEHVQKDQDATNQTKILKSIKLKNIREFFSKQRRKHHISQIPKNPPYIHIRKKISRYSKSKTMINYFKLKGLSKFHIQKGRMSKIYLDHLAQENYKKAQLRNLIGVNENNQNQFYSKQQRFLKSQNAYSKTPQYPFWLQELAEAQQSQRSTTNTNPISKQDTQQNSPGSSLFSNQRQVNQRSNILSFEFVAEDDLSSISDLESIEQQSQVHQSSNNIVLNMNQTEKMIDPQSSTQKKLSFTFL